MLNKLEKSLGNKTERLAIGTPSKGEGNLWMTGARIQFLCDMLAAGHFNHSLELTLFCK